MPWEVETVTRLVHKGEEDRTPCQVFLGNGIVLHVVDYWSHDNKCQPEIDPEHMHPVIGSLLESVSGKLEVQRQEIFAQIKIALPPFSRSRVHAIITSKLEVGRSVTVEIGGYGEPRAAQYVFESPITAHRQRLSNPLHQKHPAPR